MFHTIYKTINIINNQYYIGYHKTKNINDSYLGSGIRIQRSIKKYGKENFKKEILFISKIAEEAFQREKELVNEETLKDPLCLNLKIGGDGGFDYINKNGMCGLHNEEIQKMGLQEIRRISVENPELYKEFKLKALIGRLNSEKWRKSQELRYRKYFLNKHHSEETKKKLSEKAKINSKGSGNSQFGTCWITKDGINKKIKKEELPTWIELGWVKGRKLN